MKQLMDQDLHGKTIDRIVGFRIINESPGSNALALIFTDDTFIVICPVADNGEIKMAVWEKPIEDWMIE
jgi:hypothetical protein